MTEVYRAIRVAALVHNDVLRDARVTREARTLRDAGYVVEVHGIAPGENAEQHVIAGSDIDVFLEPKKDTRFSVQKWFQRYKVWALCLFIAASYGAVAIAAMMIQSATSASLPLMFAGIVTVTLVSMQIVTHNSNLKRPWARD